MWRETTKHERNVRIWKDELDEFVPDKVLDFHIHIFNEDSIPAGHCYKAGGHAISKYGFGDLEQDLTELYPGRDTYAVCFGLPYVGFNLRQNDAYVAEGCDNNRFFGLRLLDPQVDSPEELDAELSAGNFLGIKPYPRFARKPDVNETTLPEMLPDWAMDVVNRHGQIVMLHIPRKERLADPLNQRQLVELCTRYPNARIVLAHVGRAYYLKCIVGQVDRLRELPNLYYDLAMVQNWEVLEYAFQHLAHDKILYGTDNPIALAPGKAVEINDQYTYVTPVPWDISISDDRGTIKFTSFLYEELRAIKRAVGRTGLGRPFVDDLFFGNGMRLLDEVMNHTRKRNPVSTVTR